MNAPTSSWIKMRTNLFDDPKVFALADKLGLDVYATAGRVLAFWAWADQFTATGERLTVTSPLLDERFKCLGFASALRDVGWLDGPEGALSLPDYTKHNSQSTKRRLLTAERQHRHRVTEKKRSAVTSVTGPLSLSLTGIDQSTKPPAPKSVFTPPTLAEVTAYGKSRGGKIDAKVFWEYFEAANPPWTDKAGKPVRAWKQKFITWESNGVESRTTAPTHLPPRLAN